MSQHANFQVYVLYIRRIFWGIRRQKDLQGKNAVCLSSNQATVVFHTNHCTFASFQTPIRSFGLGAYNFAFFLILQPSFTPIVTYQLMIITEKAWRAKNPFLYTKQAHLCNIFKSSLHVTLITLHDTGLKIGALAS